jgi:hypothetical protein
MLPTDKSAKWGTLIFYIYCYGVYRNQAPLVYTNPLSYGEIIGSAMAINLIITILLAMYLYLCRKRYLERVGNVWIRYITTT